MEEEKSGLNVGDSVKVKRGIMCPDLESLCIEEWQGRVLGIIEEDSKILIRISWDSITLKNMPPYFIDQSNEDGLDFSEMYLWSEELEPAECRDTEEDVNKFLEKIPESHWWGGLGEQGKRIQRVLAGIDDKNTMEALKAWNDYLEEKLTYPFTAKVAEYQEKGPFQSGDAVVVKKITMLDEHYGIIVHLKEGDIPLCELEVQNNDSPNYQPVNDYCVWFAN